MGWWALPKLHFGGFKRCGISFSFTSPRASGYYLSLCNPRSMKIYDLLAVAGEELKLIDGEARLWEKASNGHRWPLPSASRRTSSRPATTEKMCYYTRASSYYSSQYFSFHLLLARIFQLSNYWNQRIEGRKETIFALHAFIHSHWYHNMIRFHIKSTLI